MREQAEIVDGPMTKRGATLLEAIGNTPLLDLRRIAGDVPGITLLAKAEHMNPGGSVKDRPARAMLSDGLRRGLLTPGKTILEATSGNTGIADAMIGRALGFPVTLCVPAKGSSAHKTAILLALEASAQPAARIHRRRDRWSSGRRRARHAVRGCQGGSKAHSAAALAPGSTSPKSEARWSR